MPTLVTFCLIPVDVLTAEPYSLQVGDEVNAKVSTVYTNGKLKQSLEGGGAIIETLPGAPTNLRSDESGNTQTTSRL